MTVLPDVGEIIQFPFYAKDKFAAYALAFTNSQANQLCLVEH
jgi:hypothetical protein